MILFDPTSWIRTFRERIYPRVRSYIQSAERRRERISEQHRTPLEQYVTYPAYKTLTEFGERWRGGMERWEGVPRIREKIWKTPVIREWASFGTGVARSPAVTAEFAAQIPTGIEYAIREPKLFFKSVPVGAAIYTKEMGKVFKERPWETTGEIVGTALIGKGITKGVGKIGETIKFYGKTEIPAEQIIREDVISGRQQFPVSRVHPQKLIKTFEESPYTRIGNVEEGVVKAWHATPREFAKVTEVQPGESELPGLYVAPSLSPHFLKISEPRYKLFGFGLPRPTKPAALLITTRGIERLPEFIREADFKAAREFMLTGAEKGKGYITPKYERGWRYTLREEEAVIPPETGLERVEFTKYFRWKGKKVPIHEYRVVDEVVDSIKRDVQSIERVGKVTRRYAGQYERYAEYREPIITPQRVVLSSIVKQIERETERYINEAERKSGKTPSYEPLREPSYRPPREPPYRPPKEPPYEPYEPPFEPEPGFEHREPPYEPPYEPGYEPPEESPFEPPYEPPYEPGYEPPEEPPFEPIREPVVSETLKKPKKKRKRITRRKKEIETKYRKRKYPTLTPEEVLKL